MSTCVIHGNNSDMPSGRRHSPTMTFKFTPTVTRDKNNPNKIKLKFSWKFYIGKDAYYGYKIRVGVKVNGKWYSVKTKEASPSDDWSYSGTKTSIPEFTNTSTSFKITVGAFADDAKDCYIDGNKYGWSNLFPIKTFTINAPPADYTVSYDANGGTGAPANQTCPAGKAITLSTQVPKYPLNVNYYYSSTPNPVITYNRTFLNWLGSNGNTYSPGGTFLGNSNCKMTAQWGDISFSPRILRDKYATLTYHCNGGRIDGLETKSVPCYFSKIGYSTTPNGLTAYVPGNTYTLTTSVGSNLNLYPKYSGNTIVQTLATPVRPGYIFEGWYFDNGTWQRPATAPLSITGNIDLYAKWTPVPVHRFDDNEWKDDYRYVWRFNGTSWEKVAHVYRCDGTEWTDISET